MVRIIALLMIIQSQYETSKGAAVLSRTISLCALRRSTHVCFTDRNLESSSYPTKGSQQIGIHLKGSHMC